MFWVAYTHISQNNYGQEDNATPLFDWGKYYEKAGRIVMPVSVQAHHSFMDGIHIGKIPLYFERHLDKDIFAFVAKDEGIMVATALLLGFEEYQTLYVPMRYNL